MRAKPFFKSRFAVRLGIDDQSDHWLGGSSDPFPGAECPTCKVPLLLLLDFNCKAPALQAASKGEFGPLKRLPLFVCARCFGEISYHVSDSMAVRVIQKYGDPGNYPIYEGYPNEFPRKPVALDGTVPSSLRAVIRKWNFDADPAGEALTTGDRALLEGFFGHPIFIPRFLYHHQLGGESLFVSWDESARFCPNKECQPSLWDKLLRRSHPMRFLAGVLNDPPGGLPLIEPLSEETQTTWNFFVSFFFQICERCLTITGSSASD